MRLERSDAIHRPLSPRELQMWDSLVNTADRMKIIAWRMKLSELGARQVARQVYLKTGTSGRVELMQQEIERLRASSLEIAS